MAIDNMRGKRCNHLSDTILVVATLWAGFVLAGPTGTNRTGSNMIAAIVTSSVSAAAASPATPAKVEWHQQRDSRKGRNANTVPANDAADNIRKEKGKPTIPADPHKTSGFVRLLQDIVRRRLRHSLCALPFLSQKAGVEDDIAYKNTVRRIRNLPGTRFILRFPDADIADEIWQHVRFGDEMPFNHDGVGMTKPSDLVPPTAAASVDQGPIENTPDVVPAMSDCGLDKYSWPNAKITDVNAKARGWRVLRYRAFVGNGEECYKRVRRAVLDWEFTTDQQKAVTKKGSADKEKKSMGIIWARDRSCGLDTKTTGRVQSIPLGPGGRRMVTYTECRYGIDIRQGLRFGLPKFYAANPVASVYDIVDQRCSNGDMFTSSAYATAGNHLLAGEERVTVILRRSENGKKPKVHVDILSRSRSAPSLAGRLVWPFIGKMQSSFFTAELDHLIEVGRSGAKGSYM